MSTIKRQFENDSLDHNKKHRQIELVVPLSGYAGSGKDSAAGHLTDKYKFKRIAFADILKDMVSEQYSIPRHYFDDREYKEKPLLHLLAEPADAYSKMINEYLIKEFRSEDGLRPSGFEYQDGHFFGVFYQADESKVLKPVYWTPRSICILEGSTKRSVNGSYWVSRAIKVMQDAVNAGEATNFVISDARYKNEINQLKKQMYSTQVIPIRIQRFDSTISTDPSERDLDDYPFEYILQNKSTMEEFHKNTDELLKFLPVL